MKQRIFLLMLTLLLAVGGSAQTATSVLDKAAKALTGGSVTAAFSAKGGMGNSSGTITVQGDKFVLQSPQAHIWFDGKTEWALAQGSGEVNVTTPTAAEIASMNPMNFLHLYKHGYKATLTTQGNSYEVRLVAENGKAAIKELYITLNSSNYQPSTVRLRTNSHNWTTISIRSLQKSGKKSDAFFRFNPKDHPKAEVVDLR